VQVWRGSCKVIRSYSAAKLRADPLGELTSFPRCPSWNLREAYRQGSKRRGKREIGKCVDLPLSEGYP